MLIYVELLRNIFLDKFRNVLLIARRIPINRFAILHFVLIHVEAAPKLVIDFIGLLMLRAWLDMNSFLRSELAIVEQALLKIFGLIFWQKRYF